MNNGIIILSPDGDLYEKSDESLEHRKSLCSFLEENDLVFPSYKTANYDLLSLYLVGIGYIVVHKSDKRFLIYLGEEISNKQNEWISSHINKENDYSVDVKSLNTNCVYSYNLGIDKNSKLKDLVESKLKNNKVYKLKESGCF